MTQSRFLSGFLFGGKYCMNILELDAYNLDDAVKFHNRLNPRLWTKDEHLQPQVRERLLEIADDFRQFLGVKDLAVQDITISGSNAAYTYTPNSDIDLHLVVDMPDDEVYRELFAAKKYQYNDEHDIKIGGADVELYVQDSTEPHISQGLYSVRDNQWLRVPKRVKSVMDDSSTRHKFESVGRAIERAVKSGDPAKMTRLINKIKRMRQTGLENHGEFGPENLTFKLLRNQGLIKQLYTARTAAHDQEFSLTEQEPRKPFVYGFRQVREASSPDGVSPETKMFLSEEPPMDDESVLKDFVEFCVRELKIDSLPVIKLRRDPQWPVMHKTFGRYINDRDLLEVAWGQRHLMDVLRTVAHELTHRHQHERDGAKMDHTAGETGSPWENEANARAGILMRDYGRLHPELFDAGTAENLKEATGYIPTAAEKNDPRFKMALSVDVRPGALGQAANAFMLNTDSQGHPQELRPDGLVDRMQEQLSQFKQTGVLSETVELDEVKMSPTSLRQFADSPAAQGIRAGFEAELIFAGLGEPDYGETEPDYDMDERAYSIQQVLDFFVNDDDEWGYGLSDRQRDRLEEQLDEMYIEWRDEQIRQDFQHDGEDLITELWLEDRPMEERIHDALTAGMGLSEERADEIMELKARRERGEIKGADMSEDQLEMAAQYSEARGIADDVLEEDVQGSIDTQDSTYDQALDNYRNNYSGNDDSFFSDVGLRYMSDIENQFRLDWPYMTTTGGDNESGYSLDAANDLARDLRLTLGVKTLTSGGYHSAARDNAHWIFEPDSSLTADDSDDMPVEIVSPPMPLKECLKKMEEFFAWAKSHNAYANSSTGFHMGVSLPTEFNDDVDFVKLILFLGDKYVLEQFGRDSVNYCASAMKKLKNRIGNDRGTAIADAMTLMKKNLLELAHRSLASNQGFGKYTSINPKDKYIEFRSAGGEDYFQDIDKLKNTLLRYARAMSIAGNPSADRNEYAKKLYKLIAPDTQDPTLSLFARYSAGELSAEQLKRDWAELALAKERPSSDEREWEAFDPDTGETLGTVRDFSITNATNYFRDSLKLSGFQVREKDPEAVSPRAKLAKRIKQPKQKDDQQDAEQLQARIDPAVAQVRRDWEFYRADTGDVIDRVTDINLPQANAVRADVVRRHRLPDESVRMRSVPTEQSAERARARIGNAEPVSQTYSTYADAQRAAVAQNNVQDLDPDVAQNFDRPEGIQSTVAGVPAWYIYNTRNDAIVRTFFQPTRDAADVYASGWLRNNGVRDTTGYQVRPAMETP